ncbi:MAG TPA: hypothetical protein VF463_05010 [Sphingobium sp.]
MADERQTGARLVEMAIRQVDDGSPGYRLENPFGDKVQVLPTPPAFRAMVTFKWEGAMPDEIVEMIERARSSGVEVAS